MHHKFISDDWKLPKSSLKHPCKQASGMNIENTLESINKMLIELENTIRV